MADGTVGLTISARPRDREAIMAARRQLADALNECSETTEVEISRGIGPVPVYRSRPQLAIATGDPEIVQRELRSRLESGYLTEPECIDLMLFAALYGDPALMSHLVGLGCSIDGRDDLDTSPLSASIGGAQIDGENTRWLLANGASPNEITPTGYHAIVDAIGVRDAGAVRELLNRGADLRVRVPRGGDIAGFSASVGDPTISEMLFRALEERQE